MNEIVPGVPRPPRKEDYVPIVRAHLLGRRIEGEELTLRTSLLLMRDRAIATKPIASEPGWHLLDIVEKQAGVAALCTSISVEDLRQFRYLCLRCVGTASDFDMLYSAHPAGDGEADAGG